jgi:biotin carboxyl carrier protein
MSKFKYIQIAIAAFILALSSCKNSVKIESETEATKTPVEIESLRSVPMDEMVELPAVSGYLKKETVRSSSTGFISEVSKGLGQKVQSGDLLMIIKTKEASALKTLPQDSALHISGLIQIKANSDGIISQMDHHQGDFVSEGDPLITLAQPGSLVFYLKVPYSEHAAIHIGEVYTLLLPDGKKLNGKLIRLLTTVDAGSQSQDYLIEPQTNDLVPENLWIRVPVRKLRHQGNFSLPKVCVQSNETQTEYWVMRLRNDSLAIKVPIRKGIETDSLVEILLPAFSRSDRFVAKGSYGLPDTARIEISK